MKHFNPFNAGDPVSAAKLNDLAAYAGVPQSSLPSVAGNYFNSERTNAETENHHTHTILVFATEDFAVQTTDHATVDDCPSGRCNFVNQIRSTNTYDPQMSGRDFYVHDPIAAATGGALKHMNEVFQAMWNKDSKRWECIPNQGARMQVILQEDLLAAVDRLTDPSTATAKILRKSTMSSSDDVIILELSEEEVAVVNRFEQISIDAGTYTKIEWIDGEWQPYAADCPGGSSSSWSF